MFTLTVLRKDRSLDQSYLPSITHTVTFHIFTPFQANKSICWLLSLLGADHFPSLPHCHYCQHLDDNDCHLQCLPWKVIISDVIHLTCYFVWTPNPGGSARSDSTEWKPQIEFKHSSQYNGGIYWDCCFNDWNNTFTSLLYVHAGEIKMKDN